MINDFCQLDKSEFSNIKSKYEKVFTERFNILKKFYEMKHQTLEQTIKDVYEKILQDEMFKILKKDMISGQYLNERVKQLFEQIILSQRQIIIERLGLQFSEVKSEYINLELQYKQYRNEKTNIIQNYKKKQNDYKRCREQIEQLRQEKERFEVNKQRIQQRYRKQLMIIRQQGQINQRKHRQQIKGMDEQLRRIRQQYGQKQKQYNNVCDQKIMINKKYVQCEKINQILKQQITKIQKQYQNQKLLSKNIIQNLQSKIQNISKQHYQNISQIKNSYKSKFNQYKQKVHHYKQKCHSLIQNQYKYTHNNQHHSQQQQISSIRQQYQRQIHQIHTRQQISIKQILNQHQSQITSLNYQHQQNIQKIKHQIQKSANHQIINVQNKLNSTIIHLQHQISYYDHNYISKIQHQKLITQKKNIIQKITVQNNLKQDKIRQLTHQINISQQNKIKLQKQAIQIKQKLQQNIQIVIENKKKRKGLQQNIENLKVTDRKYQQLLKQKQQKIERLQNNLEDKMKRINKIGNKYSAVSEQVRNKQEQNIKLRIRCDEVSEKYKELDREYRQLRKIQQLYNNRYIQNGEYNNKNYMKHVQQKLREMEGKYIRQNERVQQLLKDVQREKNEVMIWKKRDEQNEKLMNDMKIKIEKYNRQQQIHKKQKDQLIDSNYKYSIKQNQYQCIIDKLQNQLKYKHTSQLGISKYQKIHQSQKIKNIITKNIYSSILSLANQIKYTKSYITNIHKIYQTQIQLFIHQFKPNLQNQIHKSLHHQQQIYKKQIQENNKIIQKLQGQIIELKNELSNKYRQIMQNNLRQRRLGQMNRQNDIKNILQIQKQKYKKSLNELIQQFTMQKDMVMRQNNKKVQQSKQEIKQLNNILSIIKRDNEEVRQQLKQTKNYNQSQLNQLKQKQTLLNQVINQKNIFITKLQTANSTYTAYIHQLQSQIHLLNTNLNITPIPNHTSLQQQNVQLKQNLILLQQQLNHYKHKSNTLQHNYQLINTQKQSLSLQLHQIKKFTQTKPFKNIQNQNLKYRVEPQKKDLSTKLKQLKKINHYLQDKQKIR